MKCLQKTWLVIIFVLSISPLCLMASTKIQYLGKSKNGLYHLNNQKYSLYFILDKRNLYRVNSISNDDFKLKRAKMVHLLRLKGIKDESVLHDIQKVTRHLFMPVADYAYEDHPLRIASEQTISQPYIVAFMTGVTQIDSQSSVLEIGTGSGYQAAILGEICKEVYSVEVIPDLGNNASQLLHELGYRNIYFKIADGYRGWEQKTPFDTIIVTAATKKLPKEFLNQLKIGGRLIIPLEDQYQNQTLVKIIKTETESHFISDNLFDVRFVPMIGGNNA